MFSDSSDETVIDQMRLHFGIITGITQPIVKPKVPNKKPEKVIPHSEFSFINIMAFRAAFSVAKERGLCNPAEIMAGDEILSITG